MRWRLVLASLGLALLGLELSTEAISLVLGRFAAGVSALMSGAPFHVGAGRFVLGLVMLVAGVLLGAATLAWTGSWREVVAEGRSCPRCGERTRRRRRRWWERVASRALGEDVTRRSCDQCGWRGLALHR